MAARRIELIPKTDFAFNGANGSSQEVQLIKFINVMEYVSGILEVRVYSRTLSGIQEINLVLQAISAAPDDPSATFATSTGEIVGRVTTSVPTAVPGLSTTALTAPLPGYYRLIVRAIQLASAGVAMSATLSASLVLRDA